MRLYNILDLPQYLIKESLINNTILDELTYLGTEENHERKGASFIDASSDDEGAKYVFIRLNGYESFFAMGQLEEYDEERSDDMDTMFEDVEKHAYREQDTNYVTAITGAAEKRIREAFFGSVDSLAADDEGSGITTFDGLIDYAD